jgi:hypothetical protein
MTAFTDEIGDDPMLFPLLEILNSKPRYFRPSKASRTAIIA